MKQMFTAFEISAVANVTPWDSEACMMPIRDAETLEEFGVACISLYGIQPNSDRQIIGDYSTYQTALDIAGDIACGRPVHDMVIPEARGIS